MVPTPAAVHPQALILVCVADPPARERALSCLDVSSFPPVPPFTSFEVEALPLDAAGGRIRETHLRPRDTGVVLVSDGLLDADPPRWVLSEAGKELFHDFGAGLYATVALAPVPCCVTDVDRVAPLGAPAALLLGCVRRCLDRLSYCCPPPRPGAAGEVEVRPIVYGQDMERYFRLRHQVYSTMCYLDPLIEEYPRGLELDWFDKRSVHFGAFARESGYERLVGTGRLILTRDPGGAQGDLIEAILGSDPLLRQTVETGAVQALLPVFQSQLRREDWPKPLAALFARVTADEGLVGEVSRVIVHQDYRGRGLSRRLTQRLVEEAAAREVSDLLLECLEAHARVYAGVGFRPLGCRNSVFGINRTMTAMHRELARHNAPAVT